MKLHHGRRAPASCLLLALLLPVACGEDDGSKPLAGSPVDAAPPGPTRAPNLTCKAPERAPMVGREGLPQRLSETGCFDKEDPRRPLPFLIPYDVNMPLWSDGGSKERWLGLPDGAHITVKPDGDFELPPGTVTIKTFSLGSKPIETRFFVRLASGEWFGYAYVWEDSGADATLLDEGSLRRDLQTDAGRRTWHVPSRAECKQCHTAASGFSLGLEAGQLDGDFSYPQGKLNQLVAWERLGLFDRPVPAGLPALPRPNDSTASLESRARAYLHANCSNCHRPEVDNSGSVDLRYGTALASTMSCGQRPMKGSQGFGAQVRLLSPGDPDQSMLVLRMRLLGAGRMPEVGSLAVDEEGLMLLSSWIRSLPGCP